MVDHKLDYVMNNTVNRRLLIGIYGELHDEIPTVNCTVDYMVDEIVNTVHLYTADYTWNRRWAT